MLSSRLYDVDRLLELRVDLYARDLGRFGISVMEDLRDLCMELFISRPGYGDFHRKLTILCTLLNQKHTPTNPSTLALSLLKNTRIKLPPALSAVIESPPPTETQIGSGGTGRTVSATSPRRSRKAPYFSHSIAGPYRSSEPIPIPPNTHAGRLDSMRYGLANRENRVASYKMREAAKVPVPKAQKFKDIAAKRDAKSDRFDRLTGIVEPQVGLTFTHAISPEVRTVLENLSGNFRAAIDGVTGGIYSASGTVEDLSTSVNSVVSDAKNALSVALDGVMTGVMRMLWVIPLIGVSYYCITTERKFATKEVIVLLGTVLSLCLPAGLWDLIKGFWPKTEVFADAAEDFEPQAGVFEPASLAHIISIALTYLTVGKSDPIGIVQGFMKNMGNYSRSVSSFTSLSGFMFNVIEKFVNYIREQFGYEKMALYQTGVKAVDNWCTKVMAVVNTSHTGGDVLNPEMVQHIVALRREGTDLTNLYRFSQDVTIVLHRYLGYLDELCKLCAAAIHSFKGGRPQPVVMGITGLPGVGKTYLCKYITSHILSAIVSKERAQELDYNLDPEVFQKGSTEYWNGYAGQKAVIMDDWGQTVPSPGVDNDFIDLIRMANCWSYPLNFADLENKGKNFFRSEFILLTTNVVNLNSAEKVIVEPAAVTRRIDYGYRLTVAPEFEKNDKIDLVKVQAYVTEHGAFPYHAWNLYKHTFAVGTNAVTDYTKSWNLKEVLDEIVASLVQNKEIYRDNTAMVRNMVKARYEAQGGSFEEYIRKIPAAVANAIPSFKIPTNLMDRLTEGARILRATALDFLPWLEEMRRSPIVSFFLTISGWALIALVAKTIITSVINWFDVKKPSTSPVLEKGFKKHQGNAECVAQMLHVIRDDDFDVVVEQDGVMKIVRQFTPDMLLRAFHRLSPKAQSNEPDRLRLEHKLIKGTRVLESDVAIDPQVDLYGGGIADTAAKNLYTIEAVCETGRMGFGHILMVRDNCGIMPAHFDTHINAAIAKGTFTGDDDIIVRNTHSQTLFYKLKIKAFLAFQRVVLPGDDCVLIRLSSVRAHRDIGGFFVNESDLTNLSKVRIRLDTVEPAGDKVIYRSRSLAAVRKDTVVVGSGDETYTLATGYEYVGHTQYGDCGGVVCLEETPFMQCRRIVGIHVAGAPTLGLGFCNIITQDKINTAFKQLGLLSDVFYQSHQELALVEPPIEGSFLGLCKLKKGHNLNPTSNLTKTPLFGLWGDHPKVPAPLGRFTNTKGEFVVPMEQALKPYSTPVLIYDADVVERGCYHAFAKVRELTKDFSRTLYTFEEAVAGKSGIHGVKGMPRQTSPGYPYVLEGHSNKKKFFGFSDDYTFTGTDCANLRQKVNEVETNAKAGIRDTHIFIDFLKDELRSPEKADLGKTRLISSAPLVYTILFRMYFLPFLAAIQHTRIRNGIAVGINPYTEWNYLAEHMQTKGPHCVAGDFGGFDSSEQPQVHWAILKNINDWFNDGPINARVREVLWLEVVHSRHLGGLRGTLDTVYQWNKSLPSGHPATSVINSLYNLTVFNMCWTDVMGKHAASEFWDNVAMVVYGDDNIANIAPAAIPKFNQLSLEKSMAKFGMVYTTEDKHECVHASRTLAEISFLKRGFRKEPLINQYVGPQDLESIKYIPYWCKNIKQIEEITKANMEMTFTELALHGDATWDRLAYDMRSKYTAAMQCDTKQLFTREEYLHTAMNMDLPWL